MPTLLIDAPPAPVVLVPPRKRWTRAECATWKPHEPEPDVIVLQRDFSNFASANPRPEDLHLIVEVVDTTLSFDLTIKAALYARAGRVFGFRHAQAEAHRSSRSPIRQVHHGLGLQ